jgi:AraC-like DNA-binding protein
MVARGRKRLIAGETIHYYDTTHYLVATVDMPAVGQIVDATADAPYLCLKFDLNPATIGALIMEAELPAHNGDQPGPAFSVGRVTPELLDAACRLLSLLSTPGDISILAPLIEREILYRLLLGDQVSKLRQIAFAGSKTQQINRAIGWIRRNFREPFSINILAEEAKMSPSTLHEHFKAVTSMSPLQYQKLLRLQEARRLILSQSVDAAEAAYAVGYESPSQFNREYKRTFGTPPGRDIARLRNGPTLPEGV